MTILSSIIASFALAAVFVAVTELMWHMIHDEDRPDVLANTERD